MQDLNTNTKLAGLLVLVYDSGSDFDQKLLGIFTSIGNFIYLVHASKRSVFVLLVAVGT